MENGLNKRIQETYRNMSTNQRLIANYILQHYDKAAFLTAQQLGETLGISESTVIRFALFLEYEGYPQLHRALQDMIKNKISTVERLQLSLDNTDTNIPEKVLTTEIHNLKRTMEELDPKEFDTMVDEILQARNIYIISLRSASAVGRFLFFYLHLLLNNCRFIDGSGLFFEELSTIGPQDLAIGISFPRYTRQTIEGLKYAQERGACTLAITDSVTSPLARHARHTLLAHSEMASFIDSFVAPLSLVNALIIAVGTRDNEKTAATLAQLEDIWEAFMIYHKE